MCVRWESGNERECVSVNVCGRANESGSHDDGDYGRYSRLVLEQQQKEGRVAEHDHGSCC